MNSFAPSTGSRPTPGSGTTCTAAHEALPANTAQSKCDLYVIAG